MNAEHPVWEGRSNFTDEERALIEAKQRQLEERRRAQGIGEPTPIDAEAKREEFHSYAKRVQDEAYARGYRDGADDAPTFSWQWFCIALFIGAQMAILVDAFVMAWMRAQA